MRWETGSHSSSLLHWGPSQAECPPTNSMCPLGWIMQEQLSIRGGG